MEGGLVSGSRYLQSHGLVSVLVWSLYLSSYATVSAQGSLITCNADTVKLNVSTSLTCTFPEEVASTKRDFTIYRYLEKGNPDAVLDCWWLSGNVDCFVAPGYQYNKQISSNTVRLDIPRVSAPQIAVYACQLASYGPDSIKTCELSVQLGGKSACEIPSVKPKSQAELTCYFPGDLSKARTGFTVSHHSNQGAETTVISCTGQGESLTCVTASGYAFDKKVISHTSTSHLTIRINQALENHEGTYSCNTEGADSVDCSFMLEKEKTSTCKDQSVKENEPATFSCIFDVNVNVTKKNIKVLRKGDTGTDAVSCTWVSEKLSCTTNLGFEFPNTVTDRLVFKVPRATLEHNGTYECHLQDYQSENIQSCNFTVIPAPATPAPVGSFVAVTVAVVIVMLIPLTLIIVFVIMNSRSRTQLEKKGLDEEQPMIQTAPQEEDQTTKNFLTDLTNGFRTTHPEYKTKAYVVPSLYFNTNRYEVNTFAGEVVHVTRQPDEKTVKYDMAMGRVLTSLHLLATHGNEVMFVISQFDYNKYLSNPRNEFTNHNLPRPGELRKSDKHYGDFDILIIHRHHGLVVGVMKTCSGGCPNQQVEETPQKVVDELKQGCTQLDEAEKMLQHLLSDPRSNQNQQRQIRKLLILPNLWEERLGVVLHENQNVEQILKECLGIPETASVSKECLCGDHMRGSKRTQKIKVWFNSQFSESRDTALASDDEYAAIVARFCGSATIWSSNVLDHQSGILPKTMEDSVWMTGELFNKPILHHQQWQILNTNSPLVFLSGPPASGKTRMLVLAGKRWMSEGHKVHVVSTGKKSRAANHMIYTELSTASIEKGLPGSCHLITFEKEDMKERINTLSKLVKKDSLYIITDEAYNAKRSSFQEFVGGLLKKVPGLHLWAGSCLKGIAPQGCEVPLFEDSFTCPPAILLREDVTKLASENTVASWRQESRTTAPTDGPPVISVYHDGKGHKGDYAHDCKTCANEVIAILQTLRVIKPVGINQKPEGQSKLLSKDILVLCENDGETAVSAALKKSGVSVKIVEEKDREKVLKANNNEVWVAKGEHVFGIKRKVVVYVEGNPKDKHKMSVDLKRLRGVTSATSQLIWLKGTKKSKTVSAAEVN